MPESERYKYMAEMMKAMAHPTRLFILDCLARREHCVSELKELVGIDLSTMSRHLSVLKNADIIDSKKHNNQVFYRLMRPCVLDMYHCVIEKKAPEEETK